jgi:hypothetical protein
METCWGSSTGIWTETDFDGLFYGLLEGDLDGLFDGDLRGDNQPSLLENPFCIQEFILCFWWFPHRKPFPYPRIHSSFSAVCVFFGKLIVLDLQESWTPNPPPNLDGDFCGDGQTSGLSLVGHLVFLAGRFLLSSMGP